MQQIVYYNQFYAERNSELKTFLAEKQYETLFQNIKKNFVLVLGGDGTMLEAIHKYHKKDIPFLGINFGTKGYLLSDTSIFSEKNFVEKNSPLLEIEFQSQQNTHSFFAVNEIDINASRGKVLELEIEIVGKTSLHLKGDGLIISTPIGSTAYNRSLGGPVIPHEIPAFVLTPKAPSKPLGQPPIILDQKEKLHIKNIGRKNEALLFADGNELCQKPQTDFSLSIKKSDKQISFLVGEQYQDIWDSKPLMEQGFQRK